MDFTPLTRDGLILVENARAFIDNPRMLRREVARGNLVALRRGAFVDADFWKTLSLRSQYLLRIRAVLSVHPADTVLAGVSAAAVWGMPIAEPWPHDVTILAEWKGGGRSEPGVRHTAAGYRTAISEMIGEFRVTNLARTALDIARARSFPDALGSVDWAMWRKNTSAIPSNALSEELTRTRSRTGNAHLKRITAAASNLSDSFGESKCRAVISMLGFELPELQVEFRDAQGLIVPDFYWRGIRQAAEFDGKAKYTRNEFTHGDPTKVLWNEKKREDRLRRMVSGVTRILTEDVERPRQLEALLVAAGIPRWG